MDYKQLITGYQSTRDFKDTPIPPHICWELVAYYEKSRRLVEQIDTQMYLLEHDAVFHRLENYAGYQGKMIEAPQYLLLSSVRRDGFWENAGYIGQDLALKAKEMGVDSCFITFTDASMLGQKLQLQTDMEAVALIALGYGAGKKTRIINPTSTGGNYSKSELKIIKEKPTSRMSVADIVFLDAWTRHATVEELEERGLLDAFYFASLAPSAFNYQPWRFMIAGANVFLVVAPQTPPAGYSERVGAGAAMLYFEVVMDTSLFDVKWNLGMPKKECPVLLGQEMIGYCNI